MWLPFSSPDLLSQEIRTAWHTQDRPAFRLPYDWHNPEESRTWWIAPAPENPGYKLTKIIVSWSDRWVPGGHLFVGLHAEKGLGPEVASANPAWENRVMDRSWTWHSVLSSLLADKFRGPIHTAVSRMGCPIEIHVLAAVPEDKQRDHLHFDTVDGYTLSIAAPPEIDTQQGFLRPGAASHTLPELSHHLSRIDDDWAWIDLYVGLTVAMSPTGTEPPQSAVSIVEGLLEPFRVHLNRLPE